MKATVRVQQEGRVAIPHAVREELDVAHGDIVEIDIRLVGERNVESQTEKKDD